MSLSDKDKVNKKKIEKVKMLIGLNSSVSGRKSAELKGIQAILGSCCKKTSNSVFYEMFSGNTKSVICK